MKELTYQILTHLPLVGAWYRARLTPLFPSQIRRALGKEGVMDKYLEAVDAYKKAHPGEALTRPVIDSLMYESGVFDNLDD